MPRIELSDVGMRALRSPKRGTIDYWDAKLPGFGCRVSSGGAKTFILKIYNSRRAIGRYPTISLADARAEAKRSIAEKTLGKFRPQPIKYQVALELFLGEKRKCRRPLTVHALEYRIRRHFNFKGQLGEISHEEIARRLYRIRSNFEHDHALAALRNFYNWAKRRRYVSENPTDGLTLYGSKPRSRVLTDAELRAVWHAADGTFGTIVKLLILTGQRRGEIGALKPSWFAEDTLTIPATVAKNGREHCFPLSPMATSILKSAIHSASPSGEIFLFLARGRRGLSFSGWSKCKMTLDKASGVTGWTLHDLRRTFATIHARIGTPPHVIERLLNHKTGIISGVAAIYNRYSFMDEMRTAAERFETELMTIVGISRE